MFIKEARSLGLREAREDYQQNLGNLLLEKVSQDVRKGNLPNNVAFYILCKIVKGLHPNMKIGEVRAVMEQHLDQEIERQGGYTKAGEAMRARESEEVDSGEEEDD